MLLRIANWHGEQSADYYMRWLRTGSEADLRDYCRHGAIAKRMWKLCK